MATQSKHPLVTILPAGPRKRVWINKHVLKQFGGSSSHSPVWEVECGDVRSQGHSGLIKGDAYLVYDPEQPEHGPHAWVETQAEVWVYSAAGEAA